MKPWEKYGQAEGPWTKHKPKQGMAMSAVNAFNEAVVPRAVREAVNQADLPSWVGGFPESDPQNLGERIAANVGRTVGQAAPAILGTAALAAKIPSAIPPVAGLGERAAQSVLETFRAAPALAPAGEAVAAAGAGVGGQVAQEIYPDSGTAEMVGELAGGMAPAALANTPTGLITRAGAGVARRLSPSRQREAAERAAREAIGEQFTPAATRSVAEAEAIRETIPGFEPSLAEATGSPALVATQRSIEGKAEGANLDRYAQRHRANEEAVQRFADQNAPVGPDAEAVTARGQARIADDASRIERDAATVAARREDLAAALPVIDRAGVGADIREAIRTAKQATRQEMNNLAQELGINDADVTMEFGPIREQIERQFRPKSVLEDETKIPGAVSVLKRLDDDGPRILGPTGKPIGSKTAPVTFKDLRLYRERIGDDLRDAQSSATPNRALIRNLVALRAKVDDAVDQLAESADPDLAGRYRQFRDAYYDRYVKRFERGAVSRVNRKDGSGFYRTSDEKVADAFFAPGNVTAARQYKAVFGDSPEAQLDLASAALDSLRSAAVRDGVVDQRALTTWRRQHASVLDELPTIKEMTSSVESVNSALLSRQSQLVSRQKRIEDTLLARELQAMERGTKTPEQVIDAALKNPRKMEQITKTVSRYPEAQTALRRALWERANTGTAEDTATFMAQHEDALKKVLAPDHWANLVTIQKARAMLERVGEPRGKGISPEPLQDVQNALGMGVNQLASRIFAAESGRTSWRYITIDALGRFMRGRSQAETAALFNQALYDPRVARAMAQMTTAPNMKPAAQAKLRAWLWDAALTPDLSGPDEPAAMTSAPPARAGEAP